MTTAIFRHADRPDMKFRPFKALSHFRKLLANKEDTEQVFHIFECLPRKGLLPDAKAFVESERGKRLMESEPFLPNVLDDHAMLEALPTDSVGGAYVAFMKREGLSAAGLVTESEKMRHGKPAYDDQLEWYINRRRDTHDLLHVLTGYGRDGLGEQCVLGFTYGQNRALGNVFIAYLGGLELKRRIRAGAPVFAAIRQGQRCGTKAANLVDEDIVALLAEPLDAARKRLGIDDPTCYHAAHRAYRSVGIDPYNFEAGMNPKAA